MNTWIRFIGVALSVIVYCASTEETKPTEEHRFKIDAIGEATWTFSPSARGKVQALVALDQRDCYIHLVVRSPAGRSKNSRRLGFSRFQTRLDITSDDLNQPWTVRIKNFCEMKPISGVLKLYYPGEPAPPKPEPVPALQPAPVVPAPAPSTPIATPRIRLNSKTRSASATIPSLQSASLAFDGVVLSADPIARKHEEEGWVFLGPTATASATLTLTFSSEGWIAILADLLSLAPATLAVSSSVSPDADSALILSPPPQSVYGESTFPVWVKGSAGAVVKLTYSGSHIWFRGVLIQPGLPEQSSPQ
ncbi:MAG: hypothetical protein V2G42_03700 [bacterium JZ-2024 1]